MKKIFFLLSLCLFVFANTATAQELSPKEPNKNWKSGSEIFEARLQKMQANYELTDEQMEKLRVVNEELAKELEDIRANSTDRMETKEKMEVFYNRVDEAYKAHLTEEQYTKITEARERIQQRHNKMNKQ